MKRFFGLIPVILPILFVFFALSLPMLENGAVSSAPKAVYSALTGRQTEIEAGTEAAVNEEAGTNETTSVTVPVTEKITEETTKAVRVENTTEVRTTEAVKAAEKATEAAVQKETEEKAPETQPQTEAATEPETTAVEKKHYTAAAANKTKSAEITQMLAFGRDYTNAFAQSDEKHVYSFTATERGTVVYSVTHKKAENYGGWTLTLYQAYSPDGVGEATERRVLNVLDSSAEGATDSSVSIGLMPGEYLIIVEPASGKFTTQDYTLKAEFTPCTDHEIECNDSLSRYTELYSGVPMTGTASRFKDRQDTDVYLFRLPKQGYINLTFTHPNKDGVTVCWKVTLTNSAGREVYSENSTLSSTKLSSGRLGLKAGDYFITVSSRVYVDCEYVLKITRTSADDHETERNDQQSTADVLKLNTPTYGAMTSKVGSFDTDWYKFTVTEAGYVSLNFSHAADKNNSDKNGWRIRLLNSSGKCIYSHISAWSHEKNVSPTLGLGKGTYYVTVDCGDLFRNTAVYALNVKFTASDAWETENNGSFGTSDVLTFGKGTSAAITAADTDFDEDYFNFTLKEKGEVTVSLVSSKSAITKKIYRLTLFDADKKEVVIAGTDGKTYKDCSGGAETTARYELPAGKYYIRVTAGLYYDTHKYTVTVNK